MLSIFIFLGVVNLVDSHDVGYLPRTESNSCVVDRAADKSVGNSLMQASIRSNRHVGLSLNASDGWSNLCIDGHLAPEFLLLGCEKCATSSFAQMFQGADGVVYPDDPNGGWSHGKETHIFSRPDKFGYGKGFWLKHYPKCDQSKRMVAADFTPCYLHDTQVPWRISAYYGVRSQYIKFGVILRNPLDRMHSAFHFWKRGIGRPLCSKMQIGVTFEVYVQGLLLGSDPCGIVTVGDYATQLLGYFNVFSPSQFTIMLFRQIAAAQENVSVVISDLWDDLGLQGSGPPQVVRSNSQQDNERDGPHPTLEQDLDASTLEALKAYIKTALDVDRLASVLTVRQQNPKLARYSGPGDLASVSAWIQANW